MTPEPSAFMLSTMMVHLRLTSHQIVLIRFKSPTTKSYGRSTKRAMEDIGVIGSGDILEHLQLKFMIQTSYRMHRISPV